MMVLGVVLLVLGWLFGASILWVLGLALLIIGALIWFLGSIGRPVGHRNHYF